MTIRSLTYKISTKPDLWRFLGLVCLNRKRWRTSFIIHLSADEDKHQGHPGKGGGTRPESPTSPPEQLRLPNTTRERNGILNRPRDTPGHVRPSPRPTDRVDDRRPPPPPVGAFVLVRDGRVPVRGEPAAVRLREDGHIRRAQVGVARRGEFQLRDVRSPTVFVPLSVICYLTNTRTRLRLYAANNDRRRSGR